MSCHTINSLWACCPRASGLNKMRFEWDGKFIQQGPMATDWVFSSVPNLSQKMKTHQPSAGCSLRNIVGSCHFLTTSQQRNEEFFTENLVRLQMGTRWETWPAPKTSLYACDKAGDFTMRRLKQTENYKVHKRIFHIAEPCKVFTLEFPFLN